MSVLYESMTRLQCGPWTIRVWREWGDGGCGNNVDLLEALQSMDPVSWKALDILHKLLTLERVNAVEVLNASGCGTVGYRDWP